MAVDLAEDCYRVTSQFPREVVYGMTSQMRRASVSIAANIAEGYGRDQIGSFIQFLLIAQGSARELETHLIVAQRVNLMTNDVMAPIFSRTESVSKMLRALIRSLEARQGRAK